jgi:hypothetical protein
MPGRYIWVTSKIGPFGDEMTIISARAGDTGMTLAERFSARLEGVTSPSDIALVVRSFDLSLRAANKSGSSR